MTYMLLLNCALKLVEEIILFYDARSKKHQSLLDISTDFFRISEYGYQIDVGWGCDYLCFVESTVLFFHALCYCFTIQICCNCCSTVTQLLSTNIYRAFHNVLPDYKHL